jgi:CPA1 family monovalent cation:H+ antiporter
VLLVIGALAHGFVPGLPAVQLEPDMVFLFLSPPLLLSAALFTSRRDFCAKLSPISHTTLCGARHKIQARTPSSA